jgi:hypothetical protein
MHARAAGRISEACSRAAAMTRRKRAPQRLIWATSTVLSQVFSVEKRRGDLFTAAERLDLEGIVANRGKMGAVPEPTLTGVVPPPRVSSTPRQRHTRRKPGSRSRWPSPPLRHSHGASKDSKTAKLPI